MNAFEIMNSFYIELKPSDSARTAAQWMKNEDVGIVCVCGEDHAPLGVVTDRDIAVRVCAAGLSADNISLAEVMTPEPVVCGAQADAPEIKALMKRHGVGRLLVVDEAGRLIGLVTLAEIWHYESPFTAADLSRAVTQREFRARSARGSLKPSSWRP